MMKIIDNYLESFNGTERGWSRKKIVASVVLIVTMYIEIEWVRHGTWVDLVMVLTINFSFIAACLGLSTYQQIQGKRIDSATQPTPNPPTQ